MHSYTHISMHSFTITYINTSTRKDGTAVVIGPSRAANRRKQHATRVTAVRFSFTALSPATFNLAFGGAKDTYFDGWLLA